MLMFRISKVLGLLFVLVLSAAGIEALSPLPAATRVSNLKRQVHNVPVEPYSSPGAVPCPESTTVATDPTVQMSFIEDATISSAALSLLASVHMSSSLSSLSPSFTSFSSTSLSHIPQPVSEPPESSSRPNDPISNVPAADWGPWRKHSKPFIRKDSMTSQASISTSLSKTETSVLSSLTSFQFRGLDSIGLWTCTLGLTTANLTLTSSTTDTAVQASTKTPESAFETNLESLSTTTRSFDSMVATVHNGTTLQATTLEPTGFDDTASMSVTGSIMTSMVTSKDNMPTLLMNMTTGAVLSATSTNSSLIFSSSVPPTEPSKATRYRGFNVINKSPSNIMKNQSEWEIAFQHIRQLPGNFNAIRLYSTTDGWYKHLINAMPAARKSNLSMLVGVWSGGDEHVKRFNTEKVALDDALTRLGCDNIVAVSVGNEDMYNNHRTDQDRIPLTNITLLVDQVQEIRDVLKKHNCQNVRVTHTDTFGDWLMTNISEPLIREVDFLTVNIFPYWESQSIDVAADTFWRHMSQTIQVASSYGKEIWVGETGWPIQGKQLGAAEAGPSSALRYWQEVGCRLMQTFNAFWYVGWEPSERFSTSQDLPTSFGLLDLNGNSIVGDLTCP